MRKNYKIFISLLIVICIMFALPMPVYAENKEPSIDEIVEQELQYIFGQDADISFSLTKTNRCPYQIGIQHNGEWIDVYIPDPVSMYQADDFLNLGDMEERVIKMESNIQIAYFCIFCLIIVLLFVLGVLLATRINFRRELDERDRKTKVW